MIEAVVTDIEGTTSSLSFVKDVLFPYARAHLPDFVRRRRHEPQIVRILDEARAIAEKQLDDEGVIAQMLEWIDADRKITPLKTLQGLIWEAGYRGGDFHGHVYPDAWECLTKWRNAGIRLYVYSSGSEHAQKLLFAHTEFGDLTPLFSGYFDTRVGAKAEAQSYRRIVESLKLAPDRILFLSDIEAELDAARGAGMETIWLVRGETPDPEAAHRQVADFNAIEIA